MYLGATMVGYEPRIMQVVPIEKEIPNKQEALPYEQVSSIIESGKSFALNDCICKKEQGILGNPCDKPMDVCMGISAEPGEAENIPWGRPISKKEAYEVLNKAEEAGLVHMTSNVESGHWFICNCCGCCCGLLRAINEFNLTNIINSYYYAEIDQDECTACGICLDERCQIKAIEEGDDAYRVIKERCIGCGLCVTTCPTEAIKLVRKPDEEIKHPPKDEMGWFEERARQRGVDISQYK
jgi:electron transport complex protein RnfB